MTKHKLTTLIACLVIVQLVSSDEKTGPVLKWNSLGLTTKCPDSEWTEQVAAVRPELTKCLGMSEILMPGPKAGNDDEDPDALCQLADKWPSCWHHLDGLSCLEPSAASDMLPDFDLYDAFNIFPYHRHDLGSMVGDYRSKCAAAKVTSTPAMDDIFDDYLGGPYHDHLGDLP